MQVVLEPTIKMTEEEIKAVKLVRDMLVDIESDNDEKVSALNENFLSYTDHYTKHSPFIGCVDFLSSLLVGAGVEDENGEEIK